MTVNYKGRTLNEDKKAEVYFNLHDHVFSVRQDGLVVIHSDVVIVEDVTFKVYESRRQKVIASECKNVHARVYGYVVSTDRDDVNLTDCREAYYNPYRVHTFVDKETMEPIEECEIMYLIDKRMFYLK